jgi:membrane-associated phospholipid phosphatase
MTAQSTSTSVTEPSSSQSRGDRPRRCLDFRAAVRAFAPHDWLVLVYLVILNAALLPRFGEPGYASSALRMGLLLAFFLMMVVPIRTGLWRDGLFAPLGYRAAVSGTVQTSYFFLAAFLPLVNPRSHDHELHALDLRLFGLEPCVELQRFITPLTSEWFAFFYFCYFFILVLHTFPIVLLVEHERILGEYTFGMLIVFCVGHVVYMLVPGFGPIRALGPLLPIELPHGLWVDTVMEAVKSGGAQKDIFPSIHTAAPTFITLFSYRHRNHLPFRYSWPIVGFFAINIIIATLFLRWHWLLDVVAGLLLAILAWGLSMWATDRELERRSRLVLSPAWPLFRLRRNAAREATIDPLSPRPS